MANERLLTINFRAMGCQMAAHLEGSGPEARARLEQVPGWFEAWEQCLSRFRPDSELACLNAHAGEAVRVSPDLWDVAQLALRVARQSRGQVVPTLLGALERAGYDRSFDLMGGAAAAVSLAPLNEAEAPVEAWRSIQCRSKGRTVQLPAGVRLDLGGVAKGWAATRAARALGVLGPALVDAGGDVAISAPRAGGQGWPVGVAAPYSETDELLGVLNVRGGGVATSGRDYRRWQQGGVSQHHLIDASTGRPAQTDVLSATVLAPELWQAEMAAKVVVVSGAEAGLAWLEARPHLAGLLCVEHGPTSVITSRRLAHYLWN